MIESAHGVTIPGMKQACSVLAVETDEGVYVQPKVGLED